MARGSTRRSKAAATRSNARTVPPLRPGPSQVVVRMYGQGVGDCFLLAFPRSGDSATGRPAGEARPVYVVIDCGVVGGTPDGPARMRQIVRDIRYSTRDDALSPDPADPRGHLDLLILTHEHWDHLSGFVQAREEWDKIQVDALWLAWTEREDPSGLPAILRQVQAKQRLALTQAADRALRVGLADRYDTLFGLMSFLADAPADGLSFGAAPGVKDAWEVARALVPTNRVYCEPGDVHPVPGTDILGYVLGPPRDEDRLRQIAPKTRNPETYEASRRGAAGVPPAGSGPGRGGGAGLAGQDVSRSLERLNADRSDFNALALALLGAPLAAADAPAPSDDLIAAQDLYDRCFPFDPSRGTPVFVAQSCAWRPPPEHPVLASYYDEINHWRRIDFDWLGAAEAFALRADNLTNNTSLVIAFELPAPAPGIAGKVLLFAADAQVGNWLSWDDITTWQPRNGARPQRTPPDAADLLERTVFYKVGHHGSHNATLKEKGVERMGADGQLTAFVSVSPTVARQIKDWCRMPLDTLLDALSRRAAGRVVLPDGQLWAPAADGPPAQTPDQIGVQVSPDRLPAIDITRNGERIQADDVPLWVQIGIDF